MKDNSYISKASSVTFYEDRARVLRNLEASLANGANVLLVEGISAQVDDTSLVVRISEKQSEHAVIRAAQVERFMVESSEGGEERNRLFREEKELRRKLDAALLEERSHAFSLQSLQALEEETLERMAENPGGKSFEIGQWSTSLEEIESQLLRATQESKQALKRRQRAQQEHRRIQDLLHEEEGRDPLIQARLELQVESREAQQVLIEIEYMVPCALWRPSHIARLSHQADRSLVELTTEATVWAKTGERWENVKAYFSTARLSKPASVPLLDEDLLISRLKSAEERKQVDAEMREEVVDQLEQGRRSIDEMPGIDDGGRPLLFEAPGAVSIPNDGTPVRLECSQNNLQVEVERVIFAEVMESPHFVAKGTWSGPVPLLAGPITLVRNGEYGGRTRQEFVGVGENFRIGFGSESTVRVQRRVDHREGSSKITGKKWVEKEVHLFLSNLGAKEESFELVERVPISELTEVSVEIMGGRRADRDGFVRLPISLAAGETREEIISYRVEMSSRVQLSF